MSSKEIDKICIIDGFAFKSFNELKERNTNILYYFIVRTTQEIFLGYFVDFSCFCEQLHNNV